MKKSRKISSQNKRFNKILEDIRSIKIQGAENVARAGIKAFLIEPSKGSAKRILKTRPTEPLMQNAIKLLLKSKNKKKRSITYKNVETRKATEVTKKNFLFRKGKLTIVS